MEVCAFPSYALFFSIFFAIVVIIQFLRMYVILRGFDAAVASGREDHFIVNMPLPHVLFDRLLRFFIVVLIVMLVEGGLVEHFLTPEDFRNARTWTNGYLSWELFPLTPTAVDFIARSAAHAAVLALAFSCLILWDVTAFSSISRCDPPRAAKIKSNAYTFFYAHESSSPQLFNSLGLFCNIWSYIRTAKFGERISGLLFAIFSGFYMVFPERLEFLPLAFSSVTVFGCIFFFRAQQERFWDILRIPIKELTVYFTDFVYWTSATLIKPRLVVFIHFLRSRPAIVLIVVTAAVGITLLTITVGRLNWPNGNGGNKFDAVTIRIATSKNLWCALTLVALDQKLFENEQIKPIVNYQAAGRLNMDALISGSADLANVVETNVANQAIAGNKDLSIIGSIVHATDFGVVVHSNSGIDGPEQLRGKKIAFAPGTGAESFLYAFLKVNQLSLGDVELLRVPPSGLVDQFVNGGTDAAVSWEPSVTTMVKRTGGKARVFRDPDVYVGLMNIAIRRSWQEKNAELVHKVMDVYRKAEAFVRTHPADTQKIVAEQTGIPLTEVEEM